MKKPTTISREEADLILDRIKYNQVTKEDVEICQQLSYPKIGLHI